MPNIRPLTAELQKNAIEQLNEVPERIPDDLEALKLWIKQQPHLRACTDDQFLLGFLRGCKFSLEKTKHKLDRYFAMRTKFPEFFVCTDVDDLLLRKVLKGNYLAHLKTPLNGNGPRIGVFRMNYPPTEFTMLEMMRVMQLLMEITLLEDDYATVNGIIFVMDLAGATAAHFLQMTPSAMKTMTMFQEEAMPFRPKAQYFLNVFSGFEVIFNLLKPLMSKKQQERLFIHSNLDSLVKVLPQKYLPIEYGGENGSMNDYTPITEKRLEQYRDYFKRNEQYGTDEHLRPGKPLDFDNIFGTDGTFRKLNVD